MICGECAWEADKVKSGYTTHADIKHINDRWMEWGADHAWLGHASCKGCDCAHRDVIDKDVSE